MNRKIAVGSVTYAQKAKKALASRGIRARLVKIEARSGENGCVYGVELAEEKHLEAIRILSALDIPYRGEL